MDNSIETQKPQCLKCLQPHKFQFHWIGCDKASDHLLQETDILIEKWENLIKEANEQLGNKVDFSLVKK